MGRTNGKLVPFLKENLQMGRFMNLKYETETIFYIELPRFDRDIREEYENVLKAWYECNGNSHKYQGYSKGKQVLQAALKKSDYLMPIIGKRLKFRFATPDEIKENKRQSKEKEKSKDKVKSNLQPPSSSSDPPSVASSGYTSGNDWEIENVQTVNNSCKAENVQSVDNNIEVDNMQTGDIDLPVLPPDILEDVLKHPEDHIGDLVNDFPGESPPLQSSNSFDTDMPQIMMPEVFEPVTLDALTTRPVIELKLTPVGNFGCEKKYWLCTRNLTLKGVLLFIFEMQVVEDGSKIKEGSIVIPNGVFEPGKSYTLNKLFEQNGLLFCLFTQDIA